MRGPQLVNDNEEVRRNRGVSVTTVTKTVREKLTEKGTGVVEIRGH